MKFITINLGQQKRLLTVLFCIATICFPLKLVAQNSETLRKTYQQILESYPANLAEARSQGNRTQEAQVLSSAGIAYQYLGEYQKALELYQQALAIASTPA